MGVSELGILGGLPSLLLLICQWVGVIGLAKRARDAPWWMMACGTAASTLGIVLSIAFMVLAFTNMSSSSGSASALAGSLSGGILAVLIGAATAGLGSLSFGAGFAWHGWKSRLARDRHQELESVVAAMNEEINRLRSGTNA